MNRLYIGTAALLAMMLVAAAYPGFETPSTHSWWSSLTIRDPDPGFWRARPGAVSADARPYSAGMSSLAAMTRIRVAPGHDLELTNLGSSGSILLENGALVLTDADGFVALRRPAAAAGHDPAPATAGTMLVSGDRVLFHSSATIAFRNADSTTASVLLATEIEALPVPSQEMHVERDNVAHDWNTG